MKLKRALLNRTVVGQSVASSNQVLCDATGPKEARDRVPQLAFLAAGENRLMRSLLAIRAIEAQSSVPPIFHLLVDREARTVLDKHCNEMSWRRLVPPGRLNVVDLFSRKKAGALRYGLAYLAEGEGAKHLFKVVAHWLLTSVPRVLFVGENVFFTSDVTSLWAEFKAFTSGQVMAIAPEQSPRYDEVHKLGGVGFNSGLILMDLDAMRKSTLYNQLLYGYASGQAGSSLDTVKAGCAKAAKATQSKIKKCIRLPMLLLNGRRKLGQLADQTLLSYMSLPSAGGRKLFHVLECGWNHQTYQQGRPGYEAWRANHSSCLRAPCRAIHAGDHHGKMAIATMQAELTWQTMAREDISPPSRAAVRRATQTVCERVVREYTCAVRPWNEATSPSRRTWAGVLSSCCAAQDHNHKR